MHHDFIVIAAYDQQATFQSPIKASTSSYNTLLTFPISFYHSDKKSILAIFQTEVTHSVSYTRGAFKFPEPYLVS